jgi:hypothetical protein
MSIFSEHAAQAPRPACARCGQPSTCVVWEQPLCVECDGEWSRDARFAVGAIEETAKAHQREKTVVYTRSTAAWVREGRTQHTQEATP